VESRQFRQPGAFGVNLVSVNDFSERPFRGTRVRKQGERSDQVGERLFVIRDRDTSSAAFINNRDRYRQEISQHAGRFYLFMSVCERGGTQLACIRYTFHRLARGSRKTVPRDFSPPPVDSNLLERIGDRCCSRGVSAFSSRPSRAFDE